MLMPGDVVTALFVYSDLGGAKVRPALVVSGESFNRETGKVVLMALSAKPVRGFFEVALARWEEAGLRRPSKMRGGILITVDARLTRKIGRLAPEDWKRAVALLGTVLSKGNGDEGPEAGGGNVVGGPSVEDSASS